MNAKSTKQTGTRTTTKGTLAKTQAKAAKRTAKIAAKHEAIRKAGKAAPAGGVSMEQKVANAAGQALAQPPAKADDAAKTAATVTKGVNVPPAAKKTAKAKTSKAPKPKGKMSGLDAAAKVLAESAVPLNAKQIVEVMAAKGYWSSTAATPHATIYAGMIIEIAKKGDQARFKKVDRGLFTVTAAGKQAK